MKSLTGLTATLLTFVYYLTLVDISNGSPETLWSCLKNKGYDLETPNNTNFKNDTAAFNRRLSFQPIALVFPKSSHDVSGIVNCSADNQYNVSARSGGHSYAAYGLGGQNNSVVIDLRHLTTLQLDHSDNTVISGTGNRLGDVAKGIFEQGKRALPHGTCPYVGSGGHTSYGGFGLFSRKHGLLIDKVVSAEVVLANGAIVNASNTSNTDLFWAIRGAAPSYGIVTAWKFATVQSQPGIGFNLTWPPSHNLSQADFVTAYSAYQDFSLTAPSDLGFDGQIQADGKGGIALNFLGFWWGNQTMFNSTMKPFLDKLPKGYEFTPKNYSWIDALNSLAGPPRYSISTDGPDTTDTFYAKSLMVSNASSKAALERFATYLYTKGTHADTNWFIGFDLYGGGDSAIPKVARNATAYANREAFITYQFYASSGNKSFPNDGVKSH